MKSMQETVKFAALQSYTRYVQQVIDASFANLSNGAGAAAAPAQAGCLIPGGRK